MPIKLIQPAELGARLASDQRLNLIDVRTPAEFANVHADGAKVMPFDALDPAAILAGRREGEPIYVICQSGGRSAKACERLNEAGLEEVYSVEGGTDAWERAGLPVERSGGKTISLERQVRIVAGSLVFVGSLLAWRVHPLFLIVPIFVGGGLVFAGISNFCGMGLLLAKMPWNR